MILSRNQLQAIQKLFRSHQYERQLNPTWKSIYDIYGLGKTTRNRIQFSPSDVRRLKQLIERDTGLNLITDDLTGNRVEMAAKTANEKLSGQAVFSDLMWLMAPTPGLVNISGIDIFTPAGTFLAVSSDIALTADVPLVVIENGMVFRHIDLQTLPQPLCSAVFVYRGHGQHARHILDLIQREKNHRQVIGFFDFDPAGLCLSLDTGVSHILIPRLWRVSKEQHEMRPYNKTHEFVIQQSQLKTRMKGNTGSFKKIADAVLNQGWSLTQEHIIAHSLELEVHKLD